MRNEFVERPHFDSPRHRVLLEVHRDFGWQHLAITFPTPLRFDKLECSSKHDYKEPEASV